MDLHGKIMNIQVEENAIDKAIYDAQNIGNNLPERLRIIYKIGHRDARHASAELSLIQPEPGMCVDDGLLWQEIYSLREKLKIAVEAILSYDPKFDVKLFTHRLNSVDYDQLMEELVDRPSTCETCGEISCGDECDGKSHHTSKYSITQSADVETVRDCILGGQYRIDDGEDTHKALVALDRIAGKEKG